MENNFAGQDWFGIRDVIARYEELENIKEMTEEPAFISPKMSEDEQTEFVELKTFLAEVAGNGGDEQWNGDWYPVTFIADHYFKIYAQELAEDIGAINMDLNWPYTCIDWDQAARELQMDYSSIEFGEYTYWYR